MIDHCTLWPDRLGSLDWSACCAAHDLAYSAQADKLGADLNLMLCVAQAVPGPLGIVIGGVMLAGVTVFGGFYFREAKRRPKACRDKPPANE